MKSFCFFFVCVCVCVFDYMVSPFPFLVTYYVVTVKGLVLVSSDKWSSSLILCDVRSEIKKANKLSSTSKLS